MKTTNILRLALVGALSLALPHAATAASPGKVAVVMQKALADMPGKEGLMITVTYAPGGADDLHRHDAHVFVYVLEGSIVMQVKGGQPVTLKPGQSFYEAPDDVHLVGRNASKTKPAKFLVLLLKDANKPPVIPVKP